MSVDFFVRFNLHNSVSASPLSVEVLKPLLNYGAEELDRMLREIDRIQTDRAEAFKKKHPDAVGALKGKKVLFLGDSITSDNLGYRGAVTRAAELLSVDGAVSGGTSSMLLHSAKRYIEKEAPEIVSLMVGSNDSVSVEQKELNQVSPCEYERNVRRMVEWAKNSGAQVLLFEIPPIVEERFRQNFSRQSKLQSNETVRSYNEILKRIAHDTGISRISSEWLGESDGNYEPDGIHLSYQGQEAFAENWLEKAYELIKIKEKSYENC